MNTLKKKLFKIQPLLPLQVYTGERGGHSLAQCMLYVSPRPPCDVYSPASLGMCYPAWVYADLFLPYISFHFWLALCDINSNSRVISSGKHIWATRLSREFLLQLPLAPQAYLYNCPYYIGLAIRKFTFLVHQIAGSWKTTISFFISVFPQVLNMYLMNE